MTAPAGIPARLPGLVQVALEAGWGVDLRSWGTGQITAKLIPPRPAGADQCVHVSWRPHDGKWRLDRCEHHRPLATTPAERGITLSDVHDLVASPAYRAGEQG